MKVFCFNYSIKGQHTFLPLFICARDESKRQAFAKCKKHLRKKYGFWKVKIYPKNYPISETPEFDTTFI